MLEWLFCIHHPRRRRRLKWTALLPWQLKAYLRHLRRRQDLLARRQMFRRCQKSRHLHPQNHTRCQQSRSQNHFRLRRSALRHRHRLRWQASSRHFRHRHHKP